MSKKHIAALEQIVRCCNATAADGDIEKTDVVLQDIRKVALDALAAKGDTVKVGDTVNGRSYSFLNAHEFKTNAQLHETK